MRSFALVVLAILPLFIQYVSTQSQCAQFKTRPEWHEISEQDKQQFIDAIKKLRKQGIMEGMTQLHLANGNSKWHNSPDFLFAHRNFVQLFENELDSIYPGMVIPYWDWAAEAGNWQQSDVWNYLDGNVTCAHIGGIDWTSRVPFNHCLARHFDAGALTPWNVLDGLLAETDFFQFAEDFELGPHAQTHFAVGGDMMVMYSPNDPVFYIHHAFIDKVFYDWQVRNPTWQPPQAFLNERIPDTNVKVGDLWDASKLCYTYSGSRSADDIPVKTNLTYPIVLPEYFLKNMNYPVEKMRKVEEKLSKLYLESSV